jgi:hypothetical protein
MLERAKANSGTSSRQADPKRRCGDRGRSPGSPARRASGTRHPLCLRMRISPPNHCLWFWTGAPCSPQRTPGFPVELPGVDELHAAFLNESRTHTRRWRPCRKSGTMGRKRCFSNAFTPCTRRSSLHQQLFAAGQERWKGLRSISANLFRMFFFKTSTKSSS